MPSRTYRLDMTMMYALHGALRRELEQLARIAARSGDDPAEVLATAAGWQMFTRYLRVHHTAEDDAVWPAMRAALADRPDDLALLAAMEAEHGGLDELLRAVERDLADPASPRGRLADLLDGLVATLGRHLDHEEREAIPLIEATLTDRQWEVFGALHRERIGDDARRYLPWLLTGLDPATVADVLARMPQRLARAYREEWRPAFHASDRWMPAGDPLAG